KLAKKFIGDLSREPYPYKNDYTDPVDRILHYAKWAPSGHNEQNCSWKRLEGHSVTIITSETSFPTNKHETQRITLNMLGIFLETLEQSAHFFGYKVLSEGEPKKEKNSYILNVTLQKLNKPVDNLGDFIKARFTDR